MIYTNKLKSWLPIKTKYNSDLWYPNILINAKNNKLTIPISKNQLNINILENDFIKIALRFGNIEVTYLCIVEQLLFENSPKMVLKILKEHIWENIRKSERVEVNFFCKVILNQTIINSYITDISLTGCRILSNEQLDKNKTYTIHMFKENEINENFLKLYGNIKRRSVNGTKLEYGFQFINIANMELEAISVIIQKIHMHDKIILEKLLEKHKKSKVETENGK